MHYLGIEIGGTKLQLGVGSGDGTLAGLLRGTVDPDAGGEGIRLSETRCDPTGCGRGSGRLLRIAVRPPLSRGKWRMRNAAKKNR